MPSAYDIFAEEDGYVPGIGRKRPRFSFPSSEWRLLDEPVDQEEDNIGNDEVWFESDEELLGQDADNNNQEALAEASFGAEKSAGIVPITSSVGDVAGSKVRLVESDMPAQEAHNTYDNSQEIQTLAPASEEHSESNLPITQLSFATPRLHPITSSTLPTPSPLVQTPVDTVKVPQELSTDLPTSQPRFSHPPSTETIHHDDHLNISSDVYNTAGISGDTDQLDFQNRNIDNRDVESKHLEIDTLDMIQGGNLVQSVHGHLSSSEFTSINEFSVEKGDKPAAFDVDGLGSVNEAEGNAGDTALGLIYDGCGGQGDSKPMSAYESVFEDGTETDPNGSKFEGAVDDEASSQVQVIEVDSTSPDCFRNGSPKAGKTEDEDEESDVENRESSDEAEEEADEIMSEQSEYSYTSTGSGEESADGDYGDTLTSRTPQRVIHPEVIVLDSDSEDESPIVNAPSSMHSNGALSDTGVSSHHENDKDEMASQDIEHVEEDRDAHSEEEDDQDMSLSETKVPEYENADHDYMYTDEVYGLGERDDSQAEETKEHEAPASDMDEIVSLRGDFGKAYQQSDTPKVRPDATSNTSSVNNDIMTRDEKEDSDLLSTEKLPVEEHSFDAKEEEEQSLVPEDHPLSQEESTSSTRITQRLAYRTVSPAPIPTPALTINEESQDTYAESTVPTSSDHGSSPESNITEAEVSDIHRHHWIDGPDERHLQDSYQQLPKEEHVVHELADEDEDQSEKLDEVILVEDHSIRPVENQPHESAEVEQPDSQFDSTLNIVETPKFPIYATLAMLGEWPNEAVDVIAVAVDVSPAAASTSKIEEYQMRLRVTDISTAGTTVIVEIVQPTEKSLPRVTEGDVVLLHAFQVQNHDYIELLSSDDSGWAIISPSADQPHVTHLNVTFGEREREYVKLLQSWFREDGAAMAADHMLQLSISQEKQPSPFSAASSDAGSLESSRSGPVPRRRPRRRKGHQRVTIHELRDGRRYTEFGWLDSDSIHELRDGTVYAHSFDRTRQ